MGTNVFLSANEAAVCDVLTRLNNAWMHERGDAMTAALNSCFAENVVLRGPDLSLLGRGRDFAVQSYREFVTQAEVKHFSMQPAEIDIWGNMATAQYKWTMSYVLSGQEYSEEGSDVFMLTRCDDKWQIVWRALLPAAA